MGDSCSTDSCSVCSLLGDRAVTSEQDPNRGNEELIGISSLKDYLYKYRTRKLQLKEKIIIF